MMDVAFVIIGFASAVNLAVVILNYFLLKNLSGICKLMIECCDSQAAARTRRGGGG